MLRKTRGSLLILGTGYLVYRAADQTFTGLMFWAFAGAAFFTWRAYLEEVRREEKSDEKHETNNSVKHLVAVLSSLLVMVSLLQSSLILRDDKIEDLQTKNQKLISRIENLNSQLSDLNISNSQLKVRNALLKGQISRLKSKQSLNDFFENPPVFNPTAICNDGTYSYSANRQGTCSHHGGVRNWFQ